MISQEKCTRPTDSVNNSLKSRCSSSPRAASVLRVHYFCRLPQDGAGGRWLVTAPLPPAPSPSAVTSYRSKVRLPTLGLGGFEWGGGRKISPNQFSSTDGSVRNKSPGTLFFVFDHKTVPMYRMYVLCTRERRNISLIEM